MYSFRFQVAHSVQTPSFLWTAASSLRLQTSSQPGSQLCTNGSQQLSSQAKGSQDCDSGNDTSSPPSSKTGASHQGAANIKSSGFKLVTSPGKIKSTERDTVSDSGNSVTSYDSLCKPNDEDEAGKRCRWEAAEPAASKCSSLCIWTSLSYELLKHKHMRVCVCRDKMVPECHADSGPSSKASSGCWRRLSRISRSRRFSCSSSCSSNRSSSSRHWRRFSRSVSLSSCRWVSHLSDKLNWLNTRLQITDRFFFVVFFNDFCFLAL